MEVLAACHIHSAWSYDGSWTLESLIALFSQRGMRVLMMTEHDRGFSEVRYQQYREACKRASSEEILVIPGIEYSDPDNRIHVLVWGLRSFLGEGLSTSQMLDSVKAAGGVAVLAHPSRRRACEVFDPLWGDVLLGIEAWNRKYDGWAPSKNARAFLQSGKLIPFVGLDYHTRRQLFPLAMALEMTADITEDNVLRCLRSRSCHGQAFGLKLTDKRLQQSISVLNAAERARRTAATMVRSAKSLAKKA